MAQTTIPCLLSQQTCRIMKISCTVKTYLPSEFETLLEKKSTQNKLYIIKIFPPIYSSTNFTSTDKCLAMKPH